MIFWTYRHFTPTVQEKGLWGLLSKSSAGQRIIISLLCLVLVLVLHFKCCHFTNTCSAAINTSNSQDDFKVSSMFQCCHLQCNLEGQAGELFGITHPSGVKHLLHSNHFPFLDVCFRAQLWRQHFPLCWWKVDGLYSSSVLVL